MPDNPFQITGSDRKILRELARQKLQLSNHPDNVAKREAWYSLWSPNGHRPMVLGEHEGIVDDNRPYLPQLRCEGDWARTIENAIRVEIWRFENVRDDQVLEPCLGFLWDVSISDYGEKTVWHHSPNAGHLGARSWEGSIRNIRTDLESLHPRSFAVDRETSLLRMEATEEAIGDILKVRFRGCHWWTLGMTMTAVFLTGLENFMLFMYDDPEGVHQLMRFICDDHHALIDWYEAEGLFNLNNEEDRIGSWSLGYTRELPKPDWREGDRVRTCDVWALLESQETVGVSPELFEEFIFPYQKEIADRFGFTYYGCCEPVHSRWEVLKNLSTLRAVSVSPWCDQEYMAQALKRDYIYSRKPNPTLISTGVFDEEEIRKDIRNTLNAAGDCRLVFTMKDLHTLNDEPERLARWVALARDEIAKAGLA